MEKPLISIVICCHNRAHFLPQTLQSAFSQHYQPVEILVFDDGSTDETPALIDSYGEKIRYIRQENQGISIARTNACKQATGEYIAFLDDDDLMPPDRIEVLYRALVDHPSAVMAVGDIAFIDGDGNLTGHRWLPIGKLSRKEAILIQDGFEAVAWPTIPAVLHTVLFRKSDGEKIGWFDPKYRIASEDKDFLARLGMLGPIVYVPEIVSYYRRGHTSLTNQNVTAIYSKLILLANQLNALKPEQTKLEHHLQQRIVLTLKKIALYKIKGNRLPDTIPDDYLRRGLGLVGIHDRFRYWWQALIILPLKKILGRI